MAEIWSVVSAHADRAFRAARSSGTWESQEAYLADGLLQACRASVRSSGGQGQPAPVRPRDGVVRIDWIALSRGWATDGEVSEIAGIGPVPVPVVRAMFESGDVFLRAVVTVGRDVVNVAHLGRRPSAWQRSALLWHDPVCTVDGCDQRSRLEADHVVPWTTSKVTRTGELQWLCRHHHRLKTATDMAAVAGGGGRPP
ncbi:MAG: HNH endonuclease signature motif containing protein [Acidimicrobiia bacterium]